MDDKQKILIVEDEQDIAELISYHLQKEGFSVLSLHDGESVLYEIKKSGCDLVILDLMLPGIPGMELCRLIRENAQMRNLPIIILTAKGEESDKILGLETGADDYITKPFSPRELVARVRSIMRRTINSSTPNQIIKIGNLLLDKETHSVSKGNSPLDLTVTEFKLLLYLVERKGKVFSRDQLLDALWQDSFVEPRAVDVHIRRLRSQIEDDPANPTYIKTRRGIGYYVDDDL